MLLRKHTPADAPHVLDITFFNRIPAKDEHDVLDMFGKIEERYQNGESIQWAIVERSTNIIVGNCGYYRGFADECGEIGYVMKENFRKQGFMSEAVQLIVEFGLREMQLKKVFAVTAAANAASQGVLRKNGFVPAGTQADGNLRFDRLR
jgi:ribosomal-protein-alanine N-acetyltransferase